MSKLNDALKSGDKADQAVEERVIWLAAETHYDNACETCNGLRSVMRFVITGGPDRTPTRVGDKWLETDDAGGGPGWYHGRIETEPCPDCRANAQVVYLQNRSGLTDEEFKVRLSEFRITGVLADKAVSKQAVAKWAGAGINLAGFATLHGSYGVGKTMLAKCLVSELIRNLAPARYVITSEMINEIRSNFGETSNSLLMVENAIQHWKSIQILVMDEFDKLSMKTEWTQEVIHRLIDYRYEHRKELFTLLIMNTNPKDLPKDFGYLSSRMYAGTIVQVPGIDVRPGAK